MGSAGTNGTDGAGSAGSAGTAGTAGNAGADGADGTGFSASVTVDATAFTGHLTISGSNEADTMLMGSGGSVIHATLGDDSYTLGSGDDVVLYTSFLQSDGQVLGYTDTINGFDATEDLIDISALAGEDWNWDYSGDTLSIDVDGVAGYELIITLTGAVELATENFIA